MTFIAENWLFWLSGCITFAVIALLLQLSNMRSVMRGDTDSLFTRFGFVAIFIILYGINMVLLILSIIIHLIDYVKG